MNIRETMMGLGGVAVGSGLTIALAASEMQPPNHSKNFVYCLGAAERRVEDLKPSYSPIYEESIRNNLRQCLGKEFGGACEVTGAYNTESNWHCSTQASEEGQLTEWVLAGSDIEQKEWNQVVRTALDEGYSNAKCELPWPETPKSKICWDQAQNSGREAGFRQVQETLLSKEGNLACIWQFDDNPKQDDLFAKAWYCKRALN